MSETTQQTAASSEAQSEGTSAGAGVGGSGVPEGFVPVAELEREKARSRDFQGRFDRLQAEVADLKKGGETDKGESGFDPDAFRQALLRDVYGASHMARAAEQIRAEFPHADPGLFAPERLTGFSSVESLRLAAQTDHARVAAILDAEREAIEQKIREELAAGAAGSSGNPGGGTPTGGDPTPEELAAMTTAQLTALEDANPGVIRRILGA